MVRIQDPLSSAELYDPGAGTWSATGGMEASHGYHTATLLASGKVLVAGGLSKSEYAVASAELYDPAAGTWGSAGSMTVARFVHTATALTSGEVLVAGDALGVLEPASAELYSVAGTWSATASMAEGRQGHVATLLPSGMVLVAGGAIKDVLASAELYDPSATAFAIAPASVTVAPGASQTFTASGGSGTGYTWDLATNHSGGAITAAGVYTAGATGGVTDVVRVTDSASHTTTATVTVSMVTAALAVSPSRVTVAVGASQTFTASGGSGTGYTWDLATNSSGGAITAAGVYTAGTTGGVTDVVRVTDSASHTATATVTVTARSIPSDSNSGCSATGARFPQLAFLVLSLLVSRRRRV